MVFKLFFLYFLRLLILLLSLGTLACHIAQLALLGKMAGTGSWWPRFVPYTLYYVGSIVSVISVTILLILGLFNVRHVLGDRIASLTNLMLLIAVVVYNSLESGTIPWLGEVDQSVTSHIKGFAPYCSDYTDKNTFKRCWLVNGTWLGVIITGFVWLLLGLYTLVQPNSDFYDDDYDSYDFKNDVPMAHQVYPQNKQKQQQQQQQQEQNFYYIENEMDSLKYDHISNYPPVQNTPERLGLYSQEDVIRSNNSTPFEQKHEINNVSTSTTSNSPNEYERKRKISKTLIEEAPSIQPPHTYDY